MTKSVSTKKHLTSACLSNGEDWQPVIDREIHELLLRLGISQTSAHTSVHSCEARETDKEVDRKNYHMSYLSLAALRP